MNEQLSWLIFQVGISTVDPNTGLETVVTCGVHPLIVRPSSLHYASPSRSNLTQTIGGSILTKGGRGLQTLQIEGTFGLEDRGLLGYLGTGNVRLKRFYDEVVQLSEALSANDVSRCVDVLTGTPGVSLLVQPFNPENSVFFINFYDLWSNRSFQCFIPSFSTDTQARRGGAMGLRFYSMAVQEIGPIRAGGIGTEILSSLMSVLTAWDELNEVISSYTTAAIADSLIAGADVLAGQLANSIEAVANQLSAVQTLMGGATSQTALVGTAGFFATLEQIDLQAKRILATLTPKEIQAPPGAIYEQTFSIPSLDQAETAADLGRLLDAAAFQVVAGCFYGLNRKSYHRWVGSGGQQGINGPNSGGSQFHLVGPSDTPAIIELKWGVKWSAILEINGLTPDEALLNGVKLEIPKLRPKGPPGLGGLPTFGSHLGTDAWGADLPLEVETDDDGDLSLLAGSDLLVQGATFIVEQQSEEFFRLINLVPEEARPEYLSQRIARAILTDPRFFTVDQITVAPSPNGNGYDANLSVRAINGAETITLGIPI